MYIYSRMNTPHATSGEWPQIKKHQKPERIFKIAERLGAMKAISDACLVTSCGRAGHVKGTCDCFYSETKKRVFCKHSETRILANICLCAKCSKA